jgi:hypothetical protein
VSRNRISFTLRVKPGTAEEAVVRGLIERYGTWRRAVWAMATGKAEWQSIRLTQAVREYTDRRADAILEAWRTRRPGA